MSKCDRSAYYSKDEEKLLLQCVLRKADIVECRKTDATTSNTKNKVWTDITSEYNGLAPENIRTERQLCYKYKAIKKVWRQSAVAERRARQGTRGGKAPQEYTIIEWCTAREASHTPVSTRPNFKVANISDSARSQFGANPIDDVEGQQVTDIQNQITLLLNDDTVHEESHASVSMRPHLKVASAPVSCQENVSPLPLSNWSEYTPSMLRKQADPLLKRQNCKTTDCNDLVAKKKQVLESELSYIQLRKQHAMEEHNVRIQQSAEEHKCS